MRNIIASLGIVIVISVIVIVASPLWLKEPIFQAKQQFNTERGQNTSTRPEKDYTALIIGVLTIIVMGYQTTVFHRQANIYRRQERLMRGQLEAAKIAANAAHETADAMISIEGARVVHKGTRMFVGGTRVYEGDPGGNWRVELLFHNYGKTEAVAVKCCVVCEISPFNPTNNLPLIYQYRGKPTKIYSARTLIPMGQSSDEFAITFRNKKKHTIEVYRSLSEGQTWLWCQGYFIVRDIFEHELPIRFCLRWIPSYEASDDDAVGWVDARNDKKRENE